MSRKLNIALLVSCSLFAACLSEDPADDGPTDPTVTPDGGPNQPPPGADASQDASTTDDASTTSRFALAAPAAVEVIYGSVTEIDVSVTRTGYVGGIALSLKDPPAGITAAFEPSMVPQGTTAATSKLILTVGKEAPPSSTLTVVGTSGGEEAEASIALTVKTITVSGNTSPAATNVDVVLVDGAKRVAKKTAAGGAFTFEDVKPPYDLYTVRQVTPLGSTVSSDHVRYYRGLTRPDPTVEVGSAGGGASLALNSATISGSLGGQATPITAATPLILLWTDPAQAARLNTTPSHAGYEFKPSWAVTNTKTGTLHALQYDASTPSWRHEKIDNLTLTKNEPRTVDLTLANLPTAGALTGTVTPPASFPAPQVAVSFHLAGSTYAIPGTTLLHLPSISGMTASYVFQSEMGGASSDVSFSGVTGAKDLTYAMKKPPTHTAPATNANANATTPFRWATAEPEAVSAVHWVQGSLTVVVFTASSDTTIPSIPEKPLTAGAGTWYAEIHGPMRHVNDIAGPKGRALDSAPTRYRAAGSGRPFVWAP